MSTSVPTGSNPPSMLNFDVSALMFDMTPTPFMTSPSPTPPSTPRKQSKSLCSAMKGAEALNKSGSTSGQTDSAGGTFVINDDIINNCRPHQLSSLYINELIVPYGSGHSAAEEFRRLSAASSFARVRTTDETANTTHNTTNNTSMISNRLQPQVALIDSKMNSSSSPPAAGALATRTPSVASPTAKRAPAHRAKTEYPPTAPSACNSSQSPSFGFTPSPSIEMSLTDAYAFTYCPYGDDGIILLQQEGGQTTGCHAHSSLSSDTPLNENASVSAKPNEKRNSSGIIASVGSFLMKCATPSLMLTTGIPSSIVSTNKSVSRPVLVGIPIAQTPTASATSKINDSLFLNDPNDTIRRSPILLTSFLCDV
eukprot:GILI01009814.1.p1 GENE.GILI01009814.1~~GILI01009814.1.p1  ORF type:complete len:368 (-),score=29.16 GILI01009814.1:344-1447(-)